MDIGVALPTMAAGYDRAVQQAWCDGIDAGPVSSISCGERITFRNPEMMTTLASAASLTERVRVFVNLVVAPMHPPAVVAKQLATLDMLSGGRLTLGVGVGGREHDYRAAESPWQRRHGRLDEAVEQIRDVLAGGEAFEGADPVGPRLAEGRTIEVLAGAMGPKGLGRAARWADGVSGFALTAEGSEIREAADAARRAWSVAGRETEPRLVSGCFYVLGVDEPQETLRQFTYDYLEIFGRGAARTLSEDAPVWNTERLAQVLGEAEEAGVDEFILVPGTTDPACLAATTSYCDSATAP